MTSCADTPESSMTGPAAAATSPSAVVIPPIEQSIDLSQPVRSVTERYYTPFYRLDTDRERRHDLCLLVHSNRIALITLAPSHPVLEQGLVVKSVDCTINKRLDRKDNKAVGKSKKGGQNLFKDSVLCHLEVGERAFLFNFRTLFLSYFLGIVSYKYIVMIRFSINQKRPILIMPFFKSRFCAVIIV
jgi:hypothetical protein